MADALDAGGCVASSANYAIGSKSWAGMELAGYKSASNQNESSGWSFLIALNGDFPATATRCAASATDTFFASGATFLEV